MRSRPNDTNDVLRDRWAAIAPFDPSVQKMHESRIFATDATSQAAHFDILRTKLLLEMRRNNWTRIAITSATAGCGKTTMACNLIAGLGRQPEVRGILFDLDLRRPAVSKFFGASPTASLADVLDDKADFADQALRLHDNTIVSMTTRSSRGSRFCRGGRGSGARAGGASWRDSRRASRGGGVSGAVSGRSPWAMKARAAATSPAVTPCSC